VCIQSLQRPNDTELKLDLQKYEDNLTILNIVIAREHARQELKNKNIERECATSSSTIINVGTILSSNDQVQNMIDQCDKEDKEKSLIDVTDKSSDLKIRLEKTLKQIGKCL
jgi:uncharacterized protein YcsI (UPF0317 family)